MNLAAAPAPARPPLPAPMEHAREVGTSIAETLTTTMRTLNDGVPHFKQGHVPSDAQLDAAIAVVRGLDAKVAELVASARGVLGPTGSHRAWVGGQYAMTGVLPSAQQQQTIDDEAIATLAGATSEIVQRLEIARDTAKPAAAWLRAHTALQDAWAGALTLASEFGQVHENRFALTVEDWSRNVLSQFDLNGDGTIDVSAERISFLTRTGGGTFGMETVGSLLLRAADVDRDGRATRSELADLATSFDSERDGWISNRDDDAVVSAHPLSQRPAWSH